MNTLEEYADIKQTISDLKEKLKELEPKVLNVVESAESPIQTNYGTFTKQTRTTYKYRKVVRDLIHHKKQEIKRIQQKEIDEGKAEKKETTSIRFIQKKGGDE